MKEFIDKLTSYKLFNYFLPGIIFVVVSEQTTTFSFIQENIIVAFFLYYFIGMIISRIGSLIIEPLLIKLKIIKYAPYPEYITAAKNDKKIDILLEENNSYRTFCALCMVLLILKLYELLMNELIILSKCNSSILIIGLLILYIFSFKKQTKYITKRINNNLNNK